MLKYTQNKHVHTYCELHTGCHQRIVLLAMEKIRKEERNFLSAGVRD